MKIIDNNTKKKIQLEYESITSFKNGELNQLAKKYGLTLDELLNIITL